MEVGVLSLQGDFAAHSARLTELEAVPKEIRSEKELDGVAGLILPGGESTTLLRFFENGSWSAAIRGFARSGRPIFGTCAGAILLAREVTHPVQPSLGLMEITVERNAYGRQVESCIAMGSWPAVGPDPLEVVFIRAPIIRRVGSGVEVLLSLDAHPILVRQGNLLAATFHPELSADPRVHRYFLDRIRRTG